MFKISVIIPTFNRWPIVREALNSVLLQTVSVAEILVVDDGSTDGTAEHLAGAFPQVRYFKTANRGVSAARNLGVRMANGNWIAFLDSDDQWHPDKLATQIACIKATDAEVCFVSSQNEDGELLDDLSKMDPHLTAGTARYYPACDYRLFRHPRHPYVQSLMVTKEALVAAGSFDESLRVAEDTKLIYRLVLNHGFSAVSDILVKISRKRSVRGLSDDNDVQYAAIRHQCYARVQSEFYWIMVTRDSSVARILKVNFGYFLSRWAELACAQGKHRLARILGWEGLTQAVDWKSRIRSLLIIIAPYIYGRFSSRKWTYRSKQIACIDNDSTPDPLT